MPTVDDVDAAGSAFQGATDIGKKQILQELRGLAQIVNAHRSDELSTDQRSPAPFRFASVSGGDHEQRIAN
jgi:hypothetical protein